jgi:hypothetical protein
MAEDETSASSSPQLGTYVGTKADFSCPGDHVTFEIVLLPRSFATIELTSKLGTSNGGSKPWLVEGAWERDEDEEGLIITITKDCAMGGPKYDREVKLTLEEDGSLRLKDALYQKVQLQWSKPPPDKLAEKLRQMSVKDIKTALDSVKIDPSGCIEREDYERVYRLAHQTGKLKMEEEAAPASPTSPASPLPAEPAAKATPAAASPAPATAAPAPSASTPVPASAPAPAPAESAPAASAPAPAPAESAPTAQDSGASGSFYTLEQLTDKHIWEKLADVIASERETFLADDVFAQLFGMSKADFSKLPKWKKDNFKKKHNLF